MFLGSPCWRRPFQKHHQSQHKGSEASALSPKLKKISVYSAVSSQVHIENQLGTKHVEGIVIACLDEGSNPSGSTIKRNWFAIYNIKSPTSLLDRALLF